MLNLDELTKAYNPYLQENNEGCLLGLKVVTDNVIADKVLFNTTDMFFHSASKFVRINKFYVENGIIPYIVAFTKDRYIICKQTEDNTITLLKYCKSKEEFDTQKEIFEDLREENLINENVIIIMLEDVTKVTYI